MLFLLIVLSYINIIELNNELIDVKMIILKLLKQEVMIWL